MPIYRRPLVSTENPRVSVLESTGSLKVPFKEFTSGKQPEEFRGANGNTVLIEGVPTLGYNWEIINFNIPICVTGNVIGTSTEFEIEVTMYMLIGSRILFGARKEKIILTKGKETTQAFKNLLFAESPPIPLIVPAGQQMSLLFKSKTFLTPGKEGGGLLLITGAEGVPGANGGIESFAKTESAINYNYV